MKEAEAFILKYSRSFGSKRIIPEGIKKLEQLKGKEIIEDLKDIVSNVDILIAAYTNIKGNKGIDTPGTDNKTLDGISTEDFATLSKEIRTGAYQFKPAKVIEIPKGKGGTRRLGLPSGRDKIVQEAMRMILAVIYENKFLETSHGFRQGHSCHTALEYIRMRFAERRWFIEGDISNCFDSFDHKLLIANIKLRIKDQVFIDLLYKSLKAGYIEQGVYKDSIKGTPQGSVLSPILANIYLHDLDVYMEEYKKSFDKGLRKKSNPLYNKILRSGKTKDGRIKEPINRLKYIHKNKILPALETDESFKRISYVRYADDFLIGVIGSKKDCEKIREDIRIFLLEKLNLYLNMEKTRITHAIKERAKFLGYEIHITSLSKRKYSTRQKLGKTIKALVNTRPLLSCPIYKIKNKLYEKGYTNDKKEGTRVGRLIHFTDSYIIQHFSSLWRGIANYYSKASNFSRMTSIYYILTYSCLLTLVSKNRLGSKRKGVKVYGMPMAVGDTKFPPWGKPIVQSTTQIMDIDKFIENMSNRTQRTIELLSNSCSICGSTERVEMHHVHAIRKNKGRDFLSTQERNLKRRQIPVCQSCHNKIHKGKYHGPKL